MAGFFFAALLFLFLVISPSAAVVHYYVEDFQSAQYMDSSNTSAYWDTTAGLLRLHPFTLTEVGRCDAFSTAHDVAVAGNYAFIADYNSGLKVVDISDPTGPVLAGSYDTAGNPTGIAVSGDYAFITNLSEGLQVFDISDPLNPALAGAYDTPGNPLKVAISGNYAFVADADSGLQVVDIRDPTNPTLAGNYSAAGGQTRDVAVDGDYAYVANELAHLVIDIRNPANPALAGFYTTIGNPNGIAVSGDYAYVSETGGALLVIDISDPANPASAGIHYTPAQAMDVVISGDYAYVAVYDSVIQVIDISDPADPTPAGEVSSVGRAQSIAVEGNYVYVADLDSGLCVMNIANPVLPPAFAASNGAASEALGVTIAGDYAYVADYTSGLRVFDVSDPVNPTLAGSYNTPGMAFGIAVAGNYAFIADDATGGLQVINISDPTSPAFAGFYNTPDRATGVSVAGNYAFVADRESGLFVIDITNPASPVLAGSYDTPGAAWSTAIAGDYAYVADYVSGLQVIDIRDPATPVFAGEYDTPGYTVGVAISGDYAFLADLIDRFQVIDISDPTSPAYVGFYDQPPGGVSISIAGDYAFMASYAAGLQVFDISNPTGPTLAGRYDTYDHAYDVDVSGDFAYIADYSGGLQVIQVFERSLNIIDSTAQSIVLNEEDGEVLRVSLNTTQSGVVTWSVSADSGGSWQTVTPDGAWNKIDSTGNHLIWRSSHRFKGITEDPPTCSNLEVRWLYTFACIDSVVDVPGDEGGWLRLYMTRSGRDFSDDALPIVRYKIWRRVDSAMMGQALRSGSGEKALFLRRTRGRTLHLPVSFPPGTWEVVDSIPALQQDTYIFLTQSPTQATGSSLDYETFVVSAHTGSTSVWYLSPPDSGYSTDNIPPDTPIGFAGLTVTGGLKLSWHANTENDLSRYALYRGDAESFIPGPGTLLAETTDTSIVDSTWAQVGNYHYKLSAIDIHENEGSHALLRPDEIVATQLQAFTAVVQQQGIEITWRLSERGEKMEFFVFRSEGAGGDFLCLPGVNITSEDLSFTFIDENCEHSTHYRYRIEVLDDKGRRVLFETQSLLMPALALALGQNYPNPFNPVTTITFTLPTEMHATLSIYNLEGKRVKILVDEPLTEGFKEYIWDARDANGNPVSSGVYLYRLKAGSRTLTKKMILLR